MILLTVEEIIRLHRKLVNMTGGSADIRDRGLLESAVYSTEASFGGVEQYPDVSEKAARLAFGLISNHAFVDGNKRIGITVMLMTLKLNHIHMQYTQTELIALGLQIASGEASFENILCWITTHTAV